ncbi:MAG: hypothetical protein H8E84_06245 [Flavobacteriales bacterium]|nr:hypothetical protein [Flavobacteriales bacterium]
MFKNQYLLTNKEIPSQKDTTEICIGEFTLYFGNDIEYYTVQKNDTQITLLGYIFHCYNSLSEQELIENLLTLSKAELLDEIDLWCGHFVLFVGNKNIKVYNDASASFKVFYGEKDNNKVVSSDPKIINTFFNFEEDKNPDKLKFYQSDYFKNNPTKIGNETRFKDLHQLVSNHCLNIKNNSIERVFPRKKREELTQELASKKLIPIFNHLTALIEKRHTVYSSLTAGYDSRLLMAATKNISDKVKYYTFKLPNKKEDYIDYTLPKKITSDLGLNYSFVRIKELPNKTKEQILNSYDYPKMRPFEQYRDIFTKNEKSNILLVGFVSEVAKNYLESVTVKNGKDVVRAVHLPDNNYLEKYYQDWLDKNQNIITTYNYEILDFIHWEQDITNFAGQNTYYAHHYVRLFSIFNSREILKIMLSVPKEKRDGKSPIFFRYLIKNMWSELTDYPFNPTLKDKGILFMKKIKIYPFYKYLQVKFTNHGKI